MKATKKHAALLSALVIPALLAGCKSKPVGALPSAAETRGASNIFVGLWETNGVDNNLDHRIYKLTNTNQWESYVVKDGAVMSGIPSSKGTYSYRGSVLFLHTIMPPDAFVYQDVASNFGISMYTVSFRLDGGVLKSRERFQITLRPVSTDSETLMDKLNP